MQTIIKCCSGIMWISSTTPWVWRKQNKRTGAGKICCNAFIVLIKLKKEKAEQQVSIKNKLSFSCKTKFIHFWRRKGLVLSRCAVMLFFWAIWTESKKRIFKNVKGNEMEVLWEMIRFWSSGWDSISGTALFFQFMQIGMQLFAMHSN